MKILLAPENPAGVAAALRDGLRARGHGADLVVRHPHPFVLPHDRVAAGRRRLLREALLAPVRYDVLHWQFGMTFLEHADAAWGHVAGRPLQLMHYWGDDARTVVVAQRLGSARLTHVRLQARERSERLILLRLRLASRLCRAALVSDLELVQYVSPWFSRIYVVATPLAGPEPGPPPAALAGRAPIAFHAPSDARMKGTETILPVLERLGAEGVLRPRMVTGVPRSQVLAEMARADVIVDQLHSETPGVLALEGMALGKPVLVEFRRDRLAGSMREAPLVAMTAETLEHELRALCADRERRLELGREGRRYVSRVHDAERVAGAMEHIYAHARCAGPGTYFASVEGIEPLAPAA